MDTENDTPIVIAHRVAWKAQCASDRGELSQAVSSHREAASAFARCLDSCEDPQAQAAIHLLIAEHLTTALRIATNLALQAQERSSNAKLDERRRQEGALVSPQRKALDPYSAEAGEEASLLLVQIVQIVAVFLRAAPTMSFGQLQSTLKELSHLAAQLGQAQQRLHVSPSLPLPSADEDRLGRELQHKLRVAEELHQLLVTLELEGRGMTPQQLSSFHARFIALQQTQFSIARSELVLNAQVREGRQTIEQIQKALQVKLSELDRLLLTAAKQAQADAAAAALAVESSALVAENSMVLLPSPATAAPGATIAAGARSSGSSSGTPDAVALQAQLRLLQAEKADLHRKLEDTRRVAAAERAARLDAEKKNLKHEQRWKVLEQKVAAKKAAAGGTTPTAAGAAAAPAAAGIEAASTTGGPATGSLAKPSAAASGAQAKPSAPAPPLALLSARPVQLR